MITEALWLPGKDNAPQPFVAFHRDDIHHVAANDPTFDTIGEEA